MKQFTAIRSESLGDRLAQELRREIITGELGVGERLVEDTLAERYDVSRGPVRDALEQLNVEGLVEAVRRGFVVVGLSEADVDEIYSLRYAIESLAMTQAAQQKPDWSESRRLVEAMHRAADRRDRMQFAELDIKFHRAFYILSRHRRLLEVWIQQERTLSTLLEINPHKDSDLKGAAAAHAELLLALEANDPRWPALLEEHLYGARDRIKSDLTTRSVEHAS